MSGVRRLGEQTMTMMSKVLATKVTVASSTVVVKAAMRTPRDIGAGTQKFPATSTARNSSAASVADELKTQCGDMALCEFH